MEAIKSLVPESVRHELTPPSSGTTVNPVHRHISSFHELKEAFICKICDKGFSLEGSMKRHVASVHEEIKAFECKMCAR